MEGVVLLVIFLLGLPFILSIIAIARSGDIAGLKRSIQVLKSELQELRDELRRRTASAPPPQPQVEVVHAVEEIKASPEGLRAESTVAHFRVEEITPEPSQASPMESSRPEAAPAPVETLPPQAVETPPPEPPPPPPEMKPPPPPPTPKPRIEWERWIGVRGAALLGGIVLALAALFFFQYSIQHGLISPLMRVIFGTVAGTLCLLYAERIRKKDYEPVSQALSGAGIVILYAAFWAAHVMYDLIGMAPCFGLMILVTITCGLLSVRYNSRFIAVLGLVGGFATPPILASGSDRPIGLFSYILVLDLAFLWVAKRQRWSIVASLCLLGTVIMQAYWIFSQMGPNRLFLGLGILLIFALLFAFFNRGSTSEPKGAALIHQALGICIPFLFAFYLAGNVNLGPHLYPIAGLLFILSALALWMARAQKQIGLVNGASVATMAVVAVWLAAHPLTPAATWEVLGTLAAFALLFGLGGQIAAATASQIWLFSQAVVLIAPFIFCVYLAGSSQGLVHLYPVAGLIALLAGLSAWISRARGRYFLMNAAAFGTVLVLAVWWMIWDQNPALILEGLICSVLLAMFFHAWLERDPAKDLLNGPTPSAVFTCLGIFAFLILAFNIHPEHVFWAWLAAWLALVLLSIRHASLSLRAWIFLPTALLSALGLGSALVQVSLSQNPNLPPLTLMMIVVLGGAVAWQFVALWRRNYSGGALADHAAALFALLQLFFMLTPTLSRSFSFPEILGILLTFGFLIALSATRLKEGLWYCVALLAVVAENLIWVESYPHLNFEPTWWLVGLGVQVLSVLFFTYWPFLTGRRFIQSRLVWIAAALAGPLWFLPMKKLFVLRFGTGFIGLLPVLLGLCSLTAAARVRRVWEEGDPIRKSNLVWFLAVAMGFVSVAIPLQLKNEWITIGWAIEGFALLLLWKRLDHAGLKYFAMALLLTVTVRLVANSEVLLYHQRGSWRVINWLFYTYWIPALALIGATLLLKGLEIERIRPWEKSFYQKGWAWCSGLSAISAIAVVFVWINLAIADYFSTTSFLSLSFEHHQARDLTTSIAWGVYAITLLGLGMNRRNQALRWLSLVFLVVTIGKVFLYDLGELEDLYRVMSLVGLACSLILVSLLYQKFVFKKVKTVPEAG